MKAAMTAMAASVSAQFAAMTALSKKFVAGNGSGGDGGGARGGRDEQTKSKKENTSVQSASRWSGTRSWAAWSMSTTNTNVGVGKRVRSNRMRCCPHHQYGGGKHHHGKQRPQ